MSMRREPGAALPTRQGHRPSRLDAVLAAGRARSGAPTGEFYALPHDEARDLRAEGYSDPHTLDSVPADAAREDDDATFRLPFPESAPRNADGSYQYRVYDAASLWEWVRRPGTAIDPLDRTPLLRSDWEALRDRYSSAAADPTPAPSAFRHPITSGLWPPGVPYVPPPPPPPLSNATILDAVRDAVAAGGPEYAHPDYGPIAGWDVSAVTTMNSMFFNARAFNGDLSRWDVRAVKDMSGMFADAVAFNGDLSGWDVRNVTHMDFMFYRASAFNGDLSGWDVRNVWDMGSMFYRAAAFNGDLSGWDVRSVRYMSRMFADARAFNGDLSRWDVRDVRDMSYMFSGAAAFNGDLSGWDVRNVANMSNMFYQAAAFNGDLSRWDVNNDAMMRDMFEGAVAYRPAHALGSRRP
jgi:surface protein